MAELFFTVMSPLTKTLTLPLIFSTPWLSTASWSKLYIAPPAPPSSVASAEEPITANVEE